MRYLTALAAFLALMTAGVASAQTDPVTTSDLEMPDDSELAEADESEDSDDESLDLTEINGWELTFSGYIRGQYTRIQNDPDIEQFGRHDGFTLANARFELNGRYKDIGFRFEIDGAVDRQSTDPDEPIADVVARLKDGFGFYEPFRWARLSVGQFKPPFDVEELRSTEDLLFVTRSVGSRGVQGIEGFNVDGLSLSRQVGLRLDSETIYLSGDSGLGLHYSIAATNGQSANKNLNDNDKLAYFGRGEVRYEPDGEIAERETMVKVGAAGYFNDRTLGVRPNRIRQKEKGWTADLTIDIAGATLMGNLMQTTYTPEIESEPTRSAVAWQVKFGYKEPVFGFQPVYRLASYDPTSSLDTGTKGLVFENDALTYHTAGLNYDVPDYPVRIMANYTVTQEQTQRQLQNDRFDALVQVVW